MYIYRGFLRLKFKSKSFPFLCIVIIFHLKMGSLHAVSLSLLVISIIVGSANSDIYDGASYDFMTSKLAKDQERLLSTMIGIEGIILYKFGSSISPLQGKL